MPTWNTYRQEWDAVPCREGPTGLEVHGLLAKEGTVEQEFNKKHPKQQIARLSEEYALQDHARRPGSLELDSAHVKHECILGVPWTLTYILKECHEKQGG